VVGVLLQMMPMEESEKESEIEFWQGAVHRFEQVDKDAFTHSENQSLLTYLFPDETIRLFSKSDVSFQCTCSIPRMEDAVRTVGEQEAKELLYKKQTIIVTCEFCNSEYDFDREDVERIFSAQSKKN
jgi:molecular chaperone Hsp33